MKEYRHLARSTALQFLYQFEIKNQDTLQLSDHPEDRALQLKRISDELTLHFDHFKVRDEVKGFTTELVLGVLSKIETLDRLLEKHAHHWKLSRMARIDRTLLRLGAYEILFSTDIPAYVSINEAIELAKSFGTAESAPFVNAILDHVYRDEDALKVEKNIDPQG